LRIVKKSTADKNQDIQAMNSENLPKSSAKSPKKEQAKYEEKLPQDLIEAFEFYVKRQLQQHNMDKYKEIAKNTHKIQFQESIKKLQQE